MNFQGYSLTLPVLGALGSLGSYSKAIKILFIFYDIDEDSVEFKEDEKEEAKKKSSIIARFLKE